MTPSDATITGCHFNYGTSTGYGASVPCSSTPSANGGAQTVTAQISGLTASTTYDFQVVASSADGDQRRRERDAHHPGAAQGAPGDHRHTGRRRHADLRPRRQRPGRADRHLQVGSRHDDDRRRDRWHLRCRARRPVTPPLLRRDDQRRRRQRDLRAAATSRSPPKPSARQRDDDHATVVAGGTVTTTVTCSPQALTQCTISLRLTTTVERTPRDRDRLEDRADRDRREPQRLVSPSTRPAATCSHANTTSKRR